MAEDLSQQERELIANLIRDGKPVPARYIPSISDNPLKTELIWPGKSVQLDSTVLPFQSIEHIDEPRKEAVKQFDLFAVSDATGRQSGGWTNKLIWGDNSLILSSLINGPMRKEIDKAGGLKLIYIDPPFDVGADFSIDINIGEESVKKKPSVIEEVAYRDTWGKGTDSYASMLYSRIGLMHQLLADDGAIFLHCDYRTSGITRMILDEVFGQDRAVNEIIWWYKRWSAASSTFQKMHDTIFFYSKSENYTFNQLYQPLAPSTAAIHGDTRRINVKNESGGLTTIKTDEASKGVQLHDVWEIPFVVAHSQEQVGYPTQKPIELMARIIDAASNPGDLVADFFCGSGSFLAAAEGVRVKKDGNKSVYYSSEPRKWIGTDLGRFGIHTTRKRMIGVQRKAASEGRQFRAFEILNLGGYERAHQVGIDPTLDEEGMALQSAIKREEFIELILSAYGAQRSDQLVPFSGSKGGTAILIGGIDSAVTQDQVQQAIDTALSVGISRVDVLGFEFEMGISPAMSDAAKEQGLTLTVRYIPNEVFDKRAIAKGQVKFYEAGYVEAKCEVKNKTLQVSLIDFGVFYRQNDADETASELRSGNAKVVVDQGQVVRVAKDKKGIITKENLTSNWQDWIDYWAVDFDFASQPETITVIEDGKEVKKRTGKFIFENEWQSFRTKSDRSLELTSSPFSYADPGNYLVAVKVIDIFGNDTTRVFKIKVK